MPEEEENVTEQEKQSDYYHAKVMDGMTQEDWESVEQIKQHPEMEAFLQTILHLGKPIPALSPDGEPCLVWQGKRSIDRLVMQFNGKLIIFFKPRGMMVFEISSERIQTDPYAEYRDAG